MTPNKASLIAEKRLAIWKKLASFRDLQRIYVPGALRAMEREEEQRTSLDLPPPEAERVKLWLPSELSDADRCTGCMPSLPSMEKELRKAECYDTLDHIRDRLHAKKHLIDDRIRHVTGQRQGTKSNTIIGEVTERINLLADKYRHARSALWALGGKDEYGPIFQELKPEHLTLDYEEEEDDDALRRMARAGGDTSRKKRKKKLKDDQRRLNADVPGDTRRVLSWIWFAGNDASGGAQGLHGCTSSSFIITFWVLTMVIIAIRREYLKARARKLRWCEEVDLIREEMRRVLRFLDWRVQWWHERAEWIECNDDGVSEGLQAYALRQSDLHLRLLISFKKNWDQPANMAARAAAQVDINLEETFFA